MTEATRLTDAPGDYITEVMPDPDADAAPVKLTTNELHIVLAVLESRQEALLRERTARDLPPVYIYEGDPLPAFDTLDGELLRIGRLIMTLTGEGMQRDLALRDAAFAEMEE